jgi:hypothetical protein
MNMLFASLFALTSAAQSGGSAPAAASSVSPLSPIYACAEKSDPVLRLACFDAAVAAVKAAEARSEIITLDQPRVAAVRREAFGFRIPSLPRFGFGTPAIAAAASTGAVATSTSAAAAVPSPAQRARDEVADEQTFAVNRVGQAGGRVALYLENGSVWHLTEAVEFNAPRQTPYNVRIRTAALGSFILTVEGRNKGYRVRRVE